MEAPAAAIRVGEGDAEAVLLAGGVGGGVEEFDFEGAAAGVEGGVNVAIEAGGFAGGAGVAKVGALVVGAELRGGEEEESEKEAHRVDWSHQ